MSRTKRFIFIGGAEGSGTTLLLRLLSSPNCCVSLGGSLQKLPDFPVCKQLADAFIAANNLVWDRKLSFEEQDDGRSKWHVAMDHILAVPAFAQTSHYLFKRSFPFRVTALPRDRHTPDLWDILELWPDVRILVIYRDPRAATYSAFRRKFDSDLRRLAVVCSEQLTWLAGQVRAIGSERIRIVSYARLCADPGAALEPVANFCDIPYDQLSDAIGSEKFDTNADSRWSHELNKANSNWLDRFFNCRRLRQWEILRAGSD
jgi:Sulfotransferase family